MGLVSLGILFVGADVGVLLVPTGQDSGVTVHGQIVGVALLAQLRDSSTVQVSLPDIADRKKVRKLRAALPTPEATAEAVEVFLALSHPLRLRLMHALAHDELCVGDLAHALALSMSAVSHQLAFLRHLKLVAAREEGRKSYYRVIDAFVAHLVHDCLAHVGKERPGTPHHHPHRIAGRRREKA